MAWTKEENIKNSAIWLSKKVGLIEEKNRLLIKQKEQNKISGCYTPIKTIYRGGIYWAELGDGNIGGEKNKTRPVMVISPNRMNKGHTVVVVPVSSKFPKKSNGFPKYNNHFLLKKKDYPLLDEDSVVKFEDIRSIDVVRLRSVIFNVNKIHMQKMKNNLNFISGY